MVPQSKSFSIAGTRTDKAWRTLKSRLESNPSKSLWDSAFDDFYRMRIDTRYLDPIASIEQNDSERGEGFAIATLFCSLIEFLETCERGMNFHYIGKSQEVLQPHEYSERDGSKYFKDFLTTRKPFDHLIPPKLVDSFYRDVRCGLLHEARTKGGWFISAAASNGNLVAEQAGRITLFRSELVPALELYFADYRTRLLNDTTTQRAFIRKFDYLCIP